MRGIVAALFGILLGAHRGKCALGPLHLCHTHICHPLPGVVVLEGSQAGVLVVGRGEKDVLLLADL